MLILRGWGGRNARYRFSFAILAILAFLASGVVSGASAFPLLVRTQSLPPGMEGASYVAPLAALGGRSNVFVVNGLPKGLFVKGPLIWGVPETSGAFYITIIVIDKASGKSAHKHLILKILRRHHPVSK